MTRRGGLLCAVLAILFATVAWPQVHVLAAAFRDADGFSLAHFARIFDFERPQNLLALWNSAWLSFASVALAAALGVPLALLVSRHSFPLRGALATLAILPLLLPPIVGVLTFKQFLFGEYGIVPRLLERAFGVHWYLDGYAGVLALHAYAFFPFFYLFTLNGLKRADPALEEAAVALGASRARTLARVTLPLLAPALAGAAVLVLLNSLGSFSAPLFFAPDKEIATLRIANLREQEPAMVSALASILALVAIALLLPLRRLERGVNVASASKGQTLRPAPARSPLARGLLAALATAIVLVLLLPHLSIVVLSFGTDTGAADSLLPESFTLAHYARILSEDAFLHPIRNSLEMALLAAALCAAVGIAVAVLLADRRVRFRGLVELLAFLPMALPATVLAFNLLKTFAEPGPLTLGRALAGTWLMLPLAYFVRHLPIAVRATQSALATVDASLVEAAESLGARRGTAFRRVVLPLVLPGVLSGALLAFLSSLAEFVASLLLYIPANVPIAVEIFNRRYNRSLGEPAALSVLLLLAQAGFALLANRLIRLERSGADPAR